MIWVSFFLGMVSGAVSAVATAALMLAVHTRRTARAKPPQVKHGPLRNGGVSAALELDDPNMMAVYALPENLRTCADMHQHDDGAQPFVQMGYDSARRVADLLEDGMRYRGVL